MGTTTVGRPHPKARAGGGSWLFAVVACLLLFSVGVSAAAQVLEWRPTIAGRTRIATTLLHWVEPKAVQAGYPSSWTTALRCSVPKVVKVGSTIPCSIYEGSAEDGSLKAKISKLRRAGKGFSFGFHVTGSLKAYQPSSAPSTVPLVAPPPTTAPASPIVTAVPPTTTPRVKTTTPPPPTVAPPTTPAPPPLPPGSCSGTWSYSGQTVTASVTTPGPATVTVKAVGTQPAFTGNSASVAIGGGQDQATVAFSLSEMPDSVVAVVAASLITASCTLSG